MPAQAKARGAHADAGSSSARPAMPAPGQQQPLDQQQQQPLDQQPQLSAWSLRLSPAAAEREFWASRGPQLRQIDGAAFVMSSMNLYTAAKLTYHLSATPVTAVVLRALCLVFLLASLAQQACLCWRPAAYLRHRHAVVLATRLMRGGWMLAFFATCSEVDQLGYFVAPRVAAGVPPARIVLQLLAVATLVFCGHCLVWPLPFAWAVPVQAAYLGSCFPAMRSWKCVLGSRLLLPGTRQLCGWLVAAFECVFVGLTQLPLGEPAPLPGDASGRSSSSTSSGGSSRSGRSSGSSSSGGGGGGASVLCGDMCQARPAEALVYGWLMACGLLLPLYTIWVKEATEKHKFMHQAAAHQRGRQPALGQKRVREGCQRLHALLQLPRPWLHAVACALMLALGVAVAQLLVAVSPPPACSAGL